MTTYPQYFTNNGVGCVSVDGLVRCGLGELGIDLVKDPDTAPETFLLRTTDMALEYSFGTDIYTTPLGDIGTLGTRLTSVVIPDDANTLQVNNAITIQNGDLPTNTMILSTSADVNQILLNDDAGTAGYVLTSGGSDGSVTWSAGGSGSTPSLAEVLAVEPSGNVGDPNQNIQLSRGADTEHPYGIQVLLNGGDGRLETSFQYTATENAHFESGALYPNLLWITAENDTNPAVKNTLTSRLYADELNISSQTGDPTLIQYNQSTLTPDSLTFNAQLGGADPIGLSLDANKIGLVSGGNTDYGTAGQVLTSGGGAGTLTWTTPSGATPSLAEVLAVAPEGAGNNDQSIYLSRTPDATNIDGIQTVLNGADGKIQLSTQLAEVQSVKFKDMSITFEGTILTNEDNTDPLAPIIETSRQLVDEFRLNTQVPKSGGTQYQEASLTTSEFHLTAQLDETDPDGIYIRPNRIGLQTGGTTDYGTAGQVLTSGSESGQLTWTTPSGTPSLAEVLAVAPEGQGNLGQVISLYTDTESFLGSGRNEVSGIGIAMDFQGVEIASNLRFVNEVAPNFTHIKTFDSSVFPPIDDQPEYETFVESGYMTLTQTKNVEDVATTDYLSLEPTRIGIAVANEAVNYGTAGQVLTSGGEAGTLSWTPPTTLEKAITNGGGVATSSFQLNAIDTLDPIYARMAYDGFVVQNVVENVIVSPPVITTTTSTLSPASLVLTNEVDGGDTKTATIGVDSLSYSISSNTYVGEYEYDHMRVWNDGKGSPIYTRIKPNEITLYDDTFAMVGGTLTIKRNKFEIGADAGSAGQVIGKDVNNDLAWIAGGGATPSLADVLDVSPAGVANADQSIYLSRGVDESYPYGIQTILNDSGGALTTSFQLTENYGEKFKSGLLSPTQVYMTTEDNTTPSVINTKVSQLTANSLALQSLTGSSPLEINLAQITGNDIVLLSQAGFPTSSGIQIKRTKQIGLMTDNTYDYGTSGQVLTSGGSDGVLSWTTPSGGSQSLAQVLDVSPAGVATADQTITLSTSTDTNVMSGTGVAISTATQTTTFSATGMGTGSTTQPLNINAPFTLVSPVIDTPDLPLRYTPYAGYGDALVVYNNVGVVPDETAGYAEVIFQNISATSQSSNVTAICESDGDYMTMGQVSGTATNLYDTLFEIRGAGYISSTGHQIIGANSSGSADKSVVISYGNGVAGFQVNPSGAIAFDATPHIVSDVVSLQDGDFGDAGQYLVSQGNASPPVWTAPSTPTLNAVLTEGNSSDQDIKIQTETFNSGYKSEMRTYEMVSSLYNTETQVLSNQSTMNPNGFSTQNSADPNTLGNKYTLTPDYLLARHKTATNTNECYQTPTYLYMLEQINGGTNKGIYFATTNPSIELSDTSTTLTSRLRTDSLSFIDNTNNKTTTYTDLGINSSKSLYTIDNPTSLGIGTIGTAHTIGIGNETSTTSVSGTFTAPTPATNISSTIVPTTNWVNTFFATITSLSNYLTIDDASSTYQTLAGMVNYVSLNYALSTFQTQYGMFLYLTTDDASATYQTLAGMSSYLTTATASSTYQTLAGMVNYLTTATASATYQTLAGMSSYLTTATASSTYQTLAGMSSYLTTATASATYQTLAGMSSYLTTANASSTYQTLAGMSSYLTTATASATYQTISGIVSTQNIVSTSGNVNSTLNINSVIGVLIITPTAGTASGRTFNLPNPPPPVGYLLSINNLSGVAWTFSTTETNGYVLFQATRTASVNIGINSSGVIRYIGNIDFSGTTRPCWSL
jgi:hypothetical protein